MPLTPGEVLDNQIKHVKGILIEAIANDGDRWAINFWLGNLKALQRRRRSIVRLEPEEARLVAI